MTVLMNVTPVWKEILELRLAILVDSGHPEGRPLIPEEKPLPASVILALQ
jgi:hypothetical protein